MSWSEGSRINFLSYWLLCEFYSKEALYILYLVADLLDVLVHIGPVPVEVLDLGLQRLIVSLQAPNQLSGNLKVAL